MNSLGSDYQDLYWEIFVNRKDVYSLQQDDGKYFAQYSELTPEILFGDKTVGLYQLDKNSSVKWAVIDFDIKKEISKDDPEFNFENWKEKMERQVKSVSELLTKKGIPNYVEFSGFRGYHVWVFFNEPVEASKVKAWLDELSRDFVRVDDNITYELFPKQGVLEINKDGGQGLGSLVKAPLQKHLRTGSYTYFVDSAFNKIEGMPKLEFCKAKQLKVTETVKVKQAPKNFTGLTQNISQRSTFPVPDNVVKMTNGCEVIKGIVKKAETNKHLLNEERVIVASIGRFYGEEGVKWIHSVLSNCTDYNENTTNYHISKLSQAPVKCETIRQQLNEKCDNCKNHGRSPVSLGYTKIQEHELASTVFIEKDYIPKLLNDLGLTYTESANHFIAEHDGNEYFISKSKGTWLGSFNLIDFIKHIRPDDWELFMHQNFPDIIIDKFAFERTDKTIKEIFKYDGELVQVNKYISEADKKIEDILTDKNNYNIIAETGLGKTEALIKKIKEKNLKAIFLTPYESNAKQLKEKYEIFSIHGKVKLSDVKDAIAKGGIIASTYDGLRKILSSQVSPEEYILLIDEVHNIVTHANIRGYALNNILRNMHEFKKVITITGTPEGVINNDFKRIRFVRSKPQTLISHYRLVVSKADPVGVAIEQILNSAHKDKVVIFMNSINSLEEIKEVLIEKGIKDEEIQILNSTEKDSETYTGIVTVEKIPDGVKYILTTSVISDGVNITNEDIEAVYLLECDNLILLRQFVARFRNGIKKVVDIIPSAPDYVKGVKWFDYPVELKRITALYEKIAETKTVFLRECGLIQNPGKSDFIKKVFGKLSHEIEFLRISKDSKEVEVNYQLLTFDVLSDFHRVAYLNPEKRKEYLEYTLNLSVTVEEITAAAVDTSQAREKVKARMEEQRGDLIALLDTSTKEVITSYLQNVNPNMIRNAETELQEVYDKGLQTEDFFEKHKKLLRLKEAETLIRKYITFTKYKFPHDFIIELLKKSPKELFEFELGYMTQLNLYMVQNQEKLLKYSKKTLKVFYYAVFKFIYDYFEEHETFTFKGLLKELNNYLIHEKITKEAVKKSIFGEILGRMVKKVKWTKKAGKKVKTLGWRFKGYRTINDLADGDAKKEGIIKNSMKAYLESEITFARFNLFLASLQGEGDREENTEQMNLLNEMKRNLGRF